MKAVLCLLLLGVALPGHATRLPGEAVEKEGGKTPPALSFAAAGPASVPGEDYRAFRSLEDHLAAADRPEAGASGAVRNDDDSGREASQDAQEKSAALMRQIEMVDIPGGVFLMGDAAGNGDADEKPAHRVVIQPFRLGKYEVTRRVFAQFAAATGHVAEGCHVLDTAAGTLNPHPGMNWQNPGFAQDDRHPATCISYDDAERFIRWLNRETGQYFRLPTEAEWEYAARAGATTQYPWGDNADQGCHYANGADQTPWPGERRIWVSAMECRDGYFFTAPVGRYAANRFGLHDMIGNVWEWTSDCWNDSYRGAPADGSAWVTGDCGKRVVRGGSWFSIAFRLRTSNRDLDYIDNRFDNQGFRLAQDL